MGRIRSNSTPFQLTPTEQTVLDLVKANPNMSGQELSRSLGMSQDFINRFRRSAKAKVELAILVSKEPKSKKVTRLKRARGISKHGPWISIT